jgi:CBS domain-containing protein
MEQSPKVNMLPVVDDGRLVGLVTLHALVSAGL